jgi:uncharacterized protein (DUF58 family)
MRFQHPTSRNAPTPTPGVEISLSTLYQLADVAKTCQFADLSKHTAHAGLHHSRAHGRGLEFSEVRHYQAGDDIRSIDWRVTARTGKTHTKIFHEERQRPVYCLVDYSASMYFGTRNCFKSVVAAKLAALFAWMAVQHGDKIGGLIYTEHSLIESRPQGRKRGLMPFLKALASTPLQAFPSNTTENLMATALQKLSHVIKPGSCLIIISDFMHYTPALEQYLIPLAQHNICFACGISDPLEHELPPGNLFAIGQHNDRLILNTNDTEVCERFKQTQKNTALNVQQSLTRCQIPLLEFNTTTEPGTQLQLALGKSRRRRSRQ